MTAHVHIDAVPDDLHRQATDDVNRWRGRCVDCFARIEQVVDEAVAAMEASGREKSVRRVPMFGARIDMLRGALKTQSFAPLGKKVVKALNEIEPYLEQRNPLVHGVGRVWVDGRGNWLWTYEFSPAGKNPKAERDMIEQIAGEKLESELSKQARSPILITARAMRLSRAGGSRALRIKPTFAFLVETTGSGCRARCCPRFEAARTAGSS